MSKENRDDPPSFAEIVVAALFVGALIIIGFAIGGALDALTRPIGD